MEEARVYYLDKWGYNFKGLEESGLVSPVVSVTGKFITSAEFTDEILIYIGVSDLKSAKFILTYKMIRESDGALVFEGESVHCFIREDRSIIRLERDLPGLYNKLKEIKESGSAD